MLEHGWSHVEGPHVEELMPSEPTCYSYSSSSNPGDVPTSCT